MRYGFVIDHNRCIGCHACTVACKEEHDVPIGVYRTWVKYIEKGEFPDSKRSFGVLRCNHCDNAPCVEICPTIALYTRPDGIVDFDGSRCIGCKSCMQACPYDALYIDPRTQTAAKCNFCAHRVDVGLEPACVIVCPVQAIIAGDLDDPDSKIGGMVRRENLTTRKPEKGTMPKLFYAGIDEDLLRPSKMESGSSFLWADKREAKGGNLRTPRAGNENGGSLAREVYDVFHAPPWGAVIAAYLWAKSIAAGVLLIAALVLWTGDAEKNSLIRIASPLGAIFFTAATMALLVLDLKRPDRFLYIFIKSNFRSWLVLGGYILLAYGFVATLWLFWALRHGSVPMTLSWGAALLAAATAGYSALLFAQAKGREFWQSPLWFWQLILQAAVAGSATLIIAGAVIGSNAPVLDRLALMLRTALFVSLGLVLAELVSKRESDDAERAKAILTTGALRVRFWGLAVGMGTVLPLLVLSWPGTSAAQPVIASIAAVAGLWFFESLWIRAGQAPPLS